MEFIFSLLEKYFLIVFFAIIKKTYIHSIKLWNGTENILVLVGICIESGLKVKAFTLRTLIFRLSFGFPSWSWTLLLDYPEKHQTQVQISWSLKGQSQHSPSCCVSPSLYAPFPWRKKFFHWFEPFRDETKTISS